MTRKLASTAPIDHLGPAMQELTEQQRLYVRFYVECGGKSVDAARAAGYGSEGHPQSLYNAASRLANSPKVLAAMREEADRVMRGGALLAASAMQAIVLNPMHKDHYKAVDNMMNRAGMIVATRHEVEVTDNRTAAELKAYIAAIAAANGMTYESVLAARPNQAALPAPASHSDMAVDAEFEEVAPYTEDTARRSAGVDDDEVLLDD